VGLAGYSEYVADAPDAPRAADPGGGDVHPPRQRSAPLRETVVTHDGRVGERSALTRLLRKSALRYDALRVLA
jgi:hypothetical protein